MGRQLHVAHLHARHPQPRKLKSFLATRLRSNGIFENEILQGDREIGSCASPDLGFALPPARLHSRCAPKARRNNKCSLAELPISRSPCEISILRGDLDSLQKFLRVRLRLGSPKPYGIWTTTSSPSAVSSKRSRSGRCRAPFAEAGLRVKERA